MKKHRHSMVILYVSNRTRWFWISIVHFYIHTHKNIAQSNISSPSSEGTCRTNRDKCRRPLPNRRWCWMWLPRPSHRSSSKYWWWYWISHPSSGWRSWTVYQLWKKCFFTVKYFSWCKLQVKNQGRGFYMNFTWSSFHGHLTLHF